MDGDDKTLTFTRGVVIAALVGAGLAAFGIGVMLLTIMGMGCA